MLRELDEIEVVNNPLPIGYIKPIEEGKIKEVDTTDWPKIRRSLFDSCLCGCIYCPNGVATERNPDLSVWNDETPTKSVITFPYGHEISVGVYPPCIELLQRYLKAGNYVKVYSHGDPLVMEDLVEDLEPWIHQVEFLLHIPTSNEATLKKWEPNGKSYDERITALMIPYVLDFKTSLLIHPLMGDAKHIWKMLKEIYDFITGDIYLELIDPNTATLMGVDPMSMFNMPDDVRYLDSCILTDEKICNNDRKVVWGKHATQMLRGDWERQEKSCNSG